MDKRKRVWQIRGVLPLPPKTTRSFNVKYLACIVVLPAFCLFQLHRYVRTIVHAKYIEEIRWYDFPQTSVACSVSEETEKDMLTLLSWTLQILHSFNITTAVCYGTLWGVLRNENLLPWDTNIDLCVMDSNFSSIDLSKLQSVLSRGDIILSDYNSWRGEYSLNFRSVSGSLTLFSDSSAWYYKTHSELEDNVPEYLPASSHGRLTWLCPAGLGFWYLNCLTNVYQAFPRWLLAPPFLWHPLAGVSVPVPHDNFEMQKYLYPQDWWLEKAPPGCSSIRVANLA